MRSPMLARIERETSRREWTQAILDGMSYLFLLALLAALLSGCGDGRDLGKPVNEQYAYTTYENGVVCNGTTVAYSHDGTSATCAWVCARAGADGDVEYDVALTFYKTLDWNTPGGFGGPVCRGPKP